MSVRPIRVLLAALALGAVLAPGAAAQSERDVGEMRLYIRQLEEQVRLLTGEVEQLRHQVRLMQQGGAGAPQGQIGHPAGSDPQWQTAQPGGEPPWQTAQPGGEQQWPTEVIVDPAQVPGANSSAGAGAPPSQLGSISVGQDDPRIARDGDPGQAGAPLDLSVLAGGSAGAGGGFDGLRGGAQAAPVALPETVEVPQQPDWSQVGQAAQPAPQMAALGGSANDQYDLAYGYVLTGDYGLAEQSFRQWLQANAGHPLAGDAEFWLAESMLRQDKHREAANLFLKLYKAAPQGRKGPDSLAKLGISLAALGEQSAACATFQELDRKHPEASDLVRSQVAAASQRVGC